MRSCWWDLSGGGYDAYARMLAPYLSSSLSRDGHRREQAGARWAVALDGVYMAPPDGLTIMIVNGTGAAFCNYSTRKGRATTSARSAMSRP